MPKRFNIQYTLAEESVHKPPSFRAHGTLLASRFAPNYSPAPSTTHTAPEFVGEDNTTQDHAMHNILSVADSLSPGLDEITRDFSSLQLESKTKYNPGRDGGAFHALINSTMTSEEIRNQDASSDMKVRGGILKTRKEKSRLRSTAKQARKAHHRIICTEPGCGMTFSRNWDLWKHTRTVHKNQKPVPCQYLSCNIGSRAPGSLKIHINCCARIKAEAEVLSVRNSSQEGPSNES